MPKFKAYIGRDVDTEDCVQINGIWYYLRENFGEAKELLGQYSVYCLGWGVNYKDFDSFSKSEKCLLFSTLVD